MESLFLTNNSENRFIDELKKCLRECESFYMSVSFIKKAGLVLVSNEIEEALNRGVKGKLITSTYQNFTDIDSLETFLTWSNKYDNFECHLDFNCFGDNGFHTKGYIFEFFDRTEFIIGSSNITRFALLKNVEWNISVISKEDFSTYHSIMSEFNNLWNNTYNLKKELIDKYSIILQYSVEKWDMDYFNPEVQTIKPNSMQRKALKELRRYRDLGANRALVVAATGSGKTYLAAFDAKNFGSNRLLYIVHRATILNDAIKSFKDVFGSEHTYGLFTGEKQELNAEYIFASPQMLLKHIDQFEPNEFDYIVYDEAHHMASDGGIEIFQYFNPVFLLGLTATPERMDKKDVFGMFEYNVPFELRLRDAILTDLIVPFHYYAIRDEYVDYSSEDKRKISNEIIKNINIEFIDKQIQQYKKKDEKLKAIAFCTDIKHCHEMADAFNDCGYCAVALTGTNNTGERIKAFNDLAKENNALEIICTVDILNEGIDIPCINMVLFLRPTESQTIFLQQLGRGLRKYDNKEYLTVLDFIGNNYKRSIQIALALSSLGKTTYTENKYLMDLVNTNFASLNIPNVEIFFDELSKAEVIEYLQTESFNKIEFLKKDYNNFKKYLGVEKYPSHMDYLESEIAPDLIRFMKSNILGNKNKSYYKFLNKIGEENIPILTKDEIELVDNVSELLPLVRPDEYLLIKNYLDNGNFDYNELVGYNNKVTNDSLKHAKMVLEKKSIITKDALNVSKASKQLTDWLNDLCNYGLNRYRNEFGFDNEFMESDNSFKKYCNYRTEQVMMILKKEPSAYQKGTLFCNDGTVVLFVCLNKDKGDDELLDYKDKFLTSDEFQWESENNVTTANAIGKKLQSAHKVHLFIRKMKTVGGVTLPFTYFGTGKLTNMRESSVKAYSDKKGTYVAPTLLYDIKMDFKVPDEYCMEFNIPDKRD